MIIPRKKVTWIAAQREENKRWKETSVNIGAEYIQLNGTGRYIDWTYLDYQLWNGEQHIRYLERQSYLSSVANCIVDAINHVDPNRARASNWFSSHLYRVIVQCRRHYSHSHANGMDDLDLVVELKWDKRRFRWWNGLVQSVVKKLCESHEENGLRWNGNCEPVNSLPSSTSTISTIAFTGISILWVHMQLAPQLAGRLSPLQNCSGLISSYWDSNGAGGDKYEISSISDITWSPVGATICHCRRKRSNTKKNT